MTIYVFTFKDIKQNKQKKIINKKYHCHMCIYVEKNIK